MAGFVLGHLMDCIVDGIIAQLLGAHGDGKLAFAGSGLGLIALLEVGLGIPYDLAEEFGDAGSVVRFLESIAPEGIGHFRVSFPLGLAAHGQVHAHLRAFAREMVP